MKNVLSFWAMALILTTSVSLVSCSEDEEDTIAENSEAVRSEEDNEIDAALPTTPAEAVDLGLSVKWASYNIGATQPEECGGYFAWGETKTKSKFHWTTYTYWIPEEVKCSYLGSNISGTEYDAARAKWGVPWRMPTTAEQKELIEKCTWTWTTKTNSSGDNIYGYEVKSKIKDNGNSIFLPAAGFYDTTGYNIGAGNNEHDPRPLGCYWSASLAEGYNSCSWMFEPSYGYDHNFDDKPDSCYTAFSGRWMGYSIRAVQ